MNIIIIHRAIATMGGGEKVILETAKRLSREHNIKIITAYYNGKTTYPEFRDFEIEPLWHSDKGFWRILGKVVRHKLKDYDVIYAHAGHWYRFRNPRMVWYAHNLNSWWPYDPVYAEQLRDDKRTPYTTKAKVVKIMDKLTIPKIEKVFTNSRYTQQKIKKFANKDSEVLHPCIDIKSYKNNGKDKIFIYSARIARLKRQGVAINAFKKLNRILPDHGFKLLLIGQITDLKYAKEIFYDLPLGVCYLGAVSEERKKYLLSKCYAGIQIPFQEDFGIVPLEYGASAKPTIGIKEGGLQESISNDKTGLLIDFNKYENSIADELAGAMKYLIEHPAVAEEMGKEAKEHVTKNFDWDNNFMPKLEEEFGRVSKM